MFSRSMKTIFNSMKIKPLVNKQIAYKTVFQGNIDQLVQKLCCYPKICSGAQELVDNIKTQQSNDQNKEFETDQSKLYQIILDLLNKVSTLEEKTTALEDKVSNLEQDAQNYEYSSTDLSDLEDITSDSQSSSSSSDSDEDEKVKNNCNSEQQDSESKQEEYKIRYESAIFKLGDLLDLFMQRYCIEHNIDDKEYQKIKDTKEFNEQIYALVKEKFGMEKEVFQKLEQSFRIERDKILNPIRIGQNKPRFY